MGMVFLGPNSIVRVYGPSGRIYAIVMVTARSGNCSRNFGFEHRARYQQPDFSMNNDDLFMTKACVSML